MDHIPHSLILFALSFVSVLLLGVQAQVVRLRHNVVAFFVSLAIGSMSIFYFRLVPDASTFELVLFVLGGAFGIVASIYVHELYIRFLGISDVQGVKEMKRADDAYYEITNLKIVEEEQQIHVALREEVHHAYRALREFEYLSINDDETRTRVYKCMRVVVALTMRKHSIGSFIVTCDATNNPPSVIDDNDLVVDVYYRYRLDSPIQTRLTLNNELLRGMKC
jgi:hypothetical protein